MNVATLNGAHLDIVPVTSEDTSTSAGDDTRPAAAQSSPARHDGTRAKTRAARKPKPASAPKSPTLADQVREVCERAGNPNISGEQVRALLNLPEPKDETEAANRRNYVARLVREWKAELKTQVDHTPQVSQETSSLPAAREVNSDPGGGGVDSAAKTAAGTDIGVDGGAAGSAAASAVSRQSPTPAPPRNRAKRVRRQSAVSAHPVDKSARVAPSPTVLSLAERVAEAEQRLPFQSAPALLEALSDEELAAERELVERMRAAERAEKWKTAKARAAEREQQRRARLEIARQDAADALDARKALAHQRRVSSPHARLASLYRRRMWTLRALAGVVVAGMAWSAVNVQHNVAPTGATDPLFWFSFLLEGMISAILVVIMTGTHTVAEYGIVDDKRMVAAAELGLLGLTLTLNTFPYVDDRAWFDVYTHSIAPVMIGVALMVHHGMSDRYGAAIEKAAAAVADTGNDTAPAAAVADEPN